MQQRRGIQPAWRPDSRFAGRPSAAFDNRTGRIDRDVLAYVRYSSSVTRSIQVTKLPSTFLDRDVRYRVGRRRAVAVFHAGRCPDGVSDLHLTLRVLMTSTSPRRMAAIMRSNPAR